MPLIPTLISFSAGTTIVAADMNSNLTAIRTAFNDTAVLTDVARTITVSHTFTPIQVFNGGVTVVGASTITGALSGITTFSLSGQLTSTLVTGTAPLVVASTTFVANLNADLVDGSHASAFALASHVHAAADVTSGTFADARIAASNVTQHQAALALAASQVTSGTFADARIAASNVTQHQAAFTTLVATTLAEGSRRAVTRIGAVTTDVGTGAATVETTLHTVTVPANAMGANGSIRITVSYSVSHNGTGTSQCRVLFGGTLISTTFHSAVGTDTGAVVCLVITNRGVTNSQKAMGWGNGVNSTTEIQRSAVASAIDTTVAQDVTVTGLTTDATNEVTAHITLVELVPG